MRPSELKVGDTVITTREWVEAYHTLPEGVIGIVTFNPCRSGRTDLFDAQFSYPGCSPTSDCVQFSGAKVMRRIP